MDDMSDPLSPDGGNGALGGLVRDIGERVRALRQRNEFTLQDLGERTGLSLSMLSAVERGRTSPSLGTLHAIATALGVQVAALFARSGGEDTPITPLADQIVDTTDGGMVRRTAAYRADHDLEVYVDEWAPGTAHARRPSQHPGIEVGVVLEGTLDVQLGDDIYTAEAGDVAQFSGRRPHRISNEGNQTARAVWINLRRL